MIFSLILNLHACRDIASYVDILWAHHAIFLSSPQSSAEIKGTFLALCPDHGCGLWTQRSAGDHMKITLEPIGASLLWNKKLIINWIDACQLQSFPSKKFFYLIPVCVHWFTSTSSFSQWNKLLIVYQRGFKQIIMTLSNVQRKDTPVVWHFVIISEVPSKLPAGGKVTLVSIELLWVQSLQPWLGHDQTKGKECSLCFSRHSLGRKIAWRAQRMSV